MSQATLTRKPGRRALFGAGEGEVEEKEAPTTVAGGERTEEQLRDLLEAMEAVRKGDLTKKLTTRREGIWGELADAYNDTVEFLSIFGAEVTRVAKEVGTEGKLGVQASVPGVAGIWKDLTDNVNTMAGRKDSGSLDTSFAECGKPWDRISAGKKRAGKAGGGQN